MKQWMYTEYFSIYTQYLAYFASILILLTSAAAFSVIQTTDKKSYCLCTLFIFTLSLICAITCIYMVFNLYDNLRLLILSVSDKCQLDNQQEIFCSMNFQQDLASLKNSIILAIISFVLLVAGYFIKVKNKKWSFWNCFLYHFYLWKIFYVLHLQNLMIM